MSESDPDLAAGGEGAVELGGTPMPAGGDPTRGGRTGEVGSDPGRAPGIAADEPDDGGPAIPVGGGDVREEPDAPPLADA